MNDINLTLIDSNILIYAFDSAEKRKQNIAQNILTLCWTKKRKYAVTTQNLSEFFVNITKKVDNPLPARTAAEIVQKILYFEGFVVFASSTEAIQLALNLHISENIPYWDAVIAATMLKNGVFHILTEDVAHFSRVNNIQAENPFKS